MGSIIGILSTVILVSTLATLIFAVGAYIMARRRRSTGVEDEDAADPIPEYSEPLTGPPPDADPPDGLKSAAAVQRRPEKPAPTVSADKHEPAADDPNSPSDASASADAKPLFRRLTPTGDMPVKPGQTATTPGLDWE